MEKGRCKLARWPDLQSNLMCIESCQLINVTLSRTKQYGFWLIADELLIRSPYPA